MIPNTSVNLRSVGRVVLGVPGLAAFAASPALRRNPYPLFRMARTLDPIHRSPFGIWVLTRHQDVLAAVRHPSLGNDERKADSTAIKLGPLQRLLGRPDRPARGGPFHEMFIQLMLFRDAPDHTRLRSLVSKAFTPKVVDAHTPRIEEMVAEQLDGLAGRQHLELMSKFAYPLPARVICELLGVPEDDVPFVISQAPALAVGFDPSPMRTAEVLVAADEATRQLTDYLKQLIVQRRKEPGTDLLSRLIAAEEEGDRLSHDELVATVLLLLIAGHETTANLIGNGLLALLRHPGQLERFRADPDLDRSAVEELLRYDGPVQMVERIALEDVELGGVTIPRGRIVVLCLGAANRDPGVFREPERLDLARDPNHHVAFSGGHHFCLGASLARVEARIALGQLVRRFPELHAATDRLRWRPSFTIRGLQELPLALA
jgi:cytochrome P450